MNSLATDTRILLYLAYVPNALGYTYISLLGKTCFVLHIKQKAFYIDHKAIPCAVYMVKHRLFILKALLHLPVNDTFPIAVGFVPFR